METQMSLSNTVMSSQPEKVIVIRGRKVMLDKGVATALGVEPREINQNAERSVKWEYLRQNGLEEQYRFKLSENDANELRSQNVIINDFKYLPWVYTRKGCAYFGTSMSSPQACAQAVN